MSNLWICAKCNSPRVYTVRLDSDWGYGAGDTTRINDKKHYTEQDNKDFDDDGGHPDIFIQWCSSCDSQSDNLIVEKK